MMTVELDALPATVEAGTFMLLRQHGRPVCLVEVRAPTTAAQLRALAADRTLVSPTVIVLERAGDPTNHPTAPASESDPAARPTLSIVIPTARGGDSVARLLDSLYSEREWIDQIIVVPNGCDADATRERVAEALDGRWQLAGLVWEVIPAPVGLSHARNVGLNASSGTLTAMIDDDVQVLPGWGKAVVTAAHSHPGAWAFSTLVLADDPRTAAALWFERRGGFRKGLDEAIFTPDEYDAVTALLRVTTMGTGATCILRTDQALAIGGYCERLGAGTPSLGGEDLNILLDVLDAGGEVVYEPDIAVRHPGPTTWHAIRRQTFRYGIGLSALVTHRIATGRVALRELVGLILTALTTVTGRSGYVHKSQARFPIRLRLLELAGLTLGPFAYARATIAAMRSSPSSADEAGHLRRRTVRSGYLLLVNTGATALLGLGYWAVAARLMSPAALGVGAAVISLITALSTAGQLNFAFSLPVLIPQAGRRRRRLLLRAYATALGLTLAIGIGAMVLTPDVVHQLPGGALGAALFLVALCLWSVFSIEDGALVAAEKTWVVPIENSTFGLLKLVALAGLAWGVSDDGGRSQAADSAILTASWYLPLIVIIPVVTVILLRTLAPHADDEDGGRLRIRQFIAFDYLGSLLLQAGSTALPFVIAIAIDPAASAMFVAAWTLSTSVDVLTVNLTWPLSVAVAASPQKAAATSRAVARRIAVLIVPVVVIGIVAAPLFLEIFGHEYAASSVDVLRLLLLASLPRAAGTFAVAGLRARRKAPTVAVVQGIATVVTLAVGLGFSSVLGIDAFGIGWLLANIIAAAVALVALRRVTAGERQVSVATPTPSRPG